MNQQTARERGPLDWAMSLGNEGIALMLLAERRGDPAKAETALSQINTAFETLHDGGHAQYAAEYEDELSNARLSRSAARAVNSSNHALLNVNDSRIRYLLVQGSRSIGSIEF